MTGGLTAQLAEARAEADDAQEQVTALQVPQLARRALLTDTHTVDSHLRAPRHCACRSSFRRRKLSAHSVASVRGHGAGT